MVGVSAGRRPPRKGSLERCVILNAPQPLQNEIAFNRGCGRLRIIGPTGWTRMVGVGGVIPNAPQSQQNAISFETDCGRLRIIGPTNMDVTRFIDHEWDIHRHSNAARPVVPVIVAASGRGIRPTGLGFRMVGVSAGRRPPRKGSLERCVIPNAPQSQQNAISFDRDCGGLGTIRPTV